MILRIPSQPTSTLAQRALCPAPHGLGLLSKARAGKTVWEVMEASASLELSRGSHFRMTDKRPLSPVRALGSILLGMEGTRLFLQAEVGALCHRSNSKVKEKNLILENLHSSVCSATSLWIFLRLVVVLKERVTQKCKYCEVSNVEGSTEQ